MSHSIPVDYLRLCAHLGRNGPITLTNGSMIDFTGCLDTDNDLRVCLFHLGAEQISWSSKFQAYSIHITCEAEYIASCHATKKHCGYANYQAPGTPSRHHVDLE